MKKIKKILWLFPFSKFYENTVPQLIVADKISQKNINNVFVFCKKGLRDYCGPLQAYNAKTLSEKNIICAKCVKNAETFAALAPGKVLWITKKPKNKQLDRATNENLVSFARLDNSLDEKQPILKKGQVKKKYVNAVVQSFLNARTILQEEKPDLVIADNSLYANINAWRYKSGILKIPFYASVVGPLLGSSFRFLSYTKNFSDLWCDEAKKQWFKLKPSKKWKEKVGYLINQHLKILKKSSHYIVYSKSTIHNHPLYKKIKNAKQKYKKIVLIALSSEDEAIMCAEISGRTQPTSWFKSQNVFLSWLIKNALRLSHIYFVIRLHPRISKNKRESEESSDFSAKKKLFCDLPANVALDLPPDQASIYRLFNIADLVLSTWSSVGWEAVALGTPSICLSPERAFYPEELNNTKISSYRELYKKLLDEKTYKIKPNKMLLAKRWYTFLYQFGTLELPPIFGKMGEKKGLWQGFWFRLRRTLDPTYDIRFFYRRASQEPMDVSKLLKLFQTRATSFFNI